MGILLLTPLNFSGSRLVWRLKFNFDIWRRTKTCDNAYPSTFYLKYDVWFGSCVYFDKTIDQTLLWKVVKPCYELLLSAVLRRWCNFSYGFSYSCKNKTLVQVLITQNNFVRYFAKQEIKQWGIYCLSIGIYLCLHPLKLF